MILNCSKIKPGPAWWVTILQSCNLDDDSVLEVNLQLWSLQPQWWLRDVTHHFIEMVRSHNLPDIGLFEDKCNSAQLFSALWIKIPISKEGILKNEHEPFVSMRGLLILSPLIYFIFNHLGRCIMSTRQPMARYKKWLIANYKWRSKLAAWLKNCRIPFSLVERIEFWLLIGWDSCPNPLNNDFNCCTFAR